MGAVLFWLGVGVALALVLLAARAADRRGRRRGHHLRDGLDIYRDTREQHRDSRAGDAQGWMNRDQSWTSRSRRSKNRS